MACWRGAGLKLGRWNGLAAVCGSRAIQSEQSLRLLPSRSAILGRDCPADHNINQINLGAGATAFCLGRAHRTISVSAGRAGLAYRATQLLIV
jgi:hypothetical protein